MIGLFVCSLWYLLLFFIVIISVMETGEIRAGVMQEEKNSES